MEIVITRKVSGGNNKLIQETSPRRKFIHLESHLHPLKRVYVKKKDSLGSEV